MSPRMRSCSRDRSRRPTNKEEVSSREGVLQQSLVNFQLYIESRVKALETNTYIVTEKVAEDLQKDVVSVLDSTAKQHSPFMKLFRKQQQEAC